MLAIRPSPSRRRQLTWCRVWGRTRIRRVFNLMGRTAQRGQEFQLAPKRSRGFAVRLIDRVIFGIDIDGREARRRHHNRSLSVITPCEVRAKVTAVDRQGAWLDGKEGRGPLKSH